MPRDHHNRGCIKCGTTRRLEDMCSFKYDVYFKDEVSQSLMRVGFCKGCFEAGKFDLKKTKEALDASESKCRKERGKRDPEHCKFRAAKFTHCKPYHKYWEDIEKKHGGKSLTHKQFMDNIK